MTPAATPERRNSTTSNKSMDLFEDDLSKSPTEKIPAEEMEVDRPERDSRNSSIPLGYDFFKT